MLIPEWKLGKEGTEAQETEGQPSIEQSFREELLELGLVLTAKGGRGAHGAPLELSRNASHPAMRGRSSGGCGGCGVGRGGGLCVRDKNHCTAQFGNATTT